ncbi:hypothetical protein RCL_jg2728.t1 [Rhizophagus clarus]|uniref:Uncharacterized protein n=1 Tax=Rhizophagus clarus TaxID=94130 RepID=A0A8H3MB86_9GLOM|nr:hypothetical protein RCL_jg2728.t1 [Rhizophagus clarus]
MTNNRKERRKQRRKQKNERKSEEKKEKEVAESLVDQVRTDIIELQTVIGNQNTEQTNQLFEKIIDKLNRIEEEIKDLKIKYNKLQSDHDELKLDHNVLKLEHNEMKLKFDEMKLKFVKSEREKEVNRKCRDFVGRFLFKLSRKLNYQDIYMLSEEYEYGNRQEVKNKIEAKLGFVKMKAYEFKQISDFRLTSNDYSHGIKNQSAYDALIMIDNMDFPKEMAHLKAPFTKRGSVHKFQPYATNLTSGSTLSLWYLFERIPKNIALNSSI